LNYLLEGNSLKYGPGYIHILPKIHRLDHLVLKNIFNCGINIDKLIPPGRPIGNISLIGMFVNILVMLKLTNQQFACGLNDSILLMKSMKNH
jgi:hypothetical protein